VHSNLEALTAVFSEIDRLDIKDIYSLGDIIGYGPSPNECIELLLRKKVLSVLGNHDLTSLNDSAMNSMNQFAEEAARKNLAELTPLSKDYISHLKPREIVDDMLFVHARPPGDCDHYVHKAEEVLDSMLFSRFEQKFCFVGHTHKPFIFKFDKTDNYSDFLKARKVRDEIYYHHKKDVITEFRSTVISLDKDSRYMINPGSVGQPRNKDRRASFVIMNDDYIGIRRVEYDIKKTGDMIKSKGYPEFLYKRLLKGI
jgi:predicted phosphodiesterase